MSFSSISIESFSVVSWSVKKRHVISDHCQKRLIATSMNESSRAERRFEDDATGSFLSDRNFYCRNRLLDPEDRSIQSSMERFNSLTSGHRACQGCGEALGARYAVDAAMRAVNGRLAAANATGCLEVFSTPYPETSWQLPWFHSLFGNTAAVATGMAAAFRMRAKRQANR